MQAVHPLVFLKGYLRNPRVVGSMVPSSQALAAAVCEPYRTSGRPATVLEVGAGTGPITRHIGTILGPSDEFDICELNSGFADVIARDILTNSNFAPAVDQGRVRLIRSPVQELKAQGRYDFVISGLPFTSFSEEDVRDVLDVVQRSLKAGGVFSYYEYVGMRKTLRAFTLGKGRQRIRQVSALLTQSIESHQFMKRTIYFNFPPAHARHLRFD